MKNDTIPELILDSCARPELVSKTALCVAVEEGPGEELTYGGLSRTIRKTAIELRGHGLSRGDRVVLISESRPLWSGAYLGILAEGGVCVPVDPAARESEIREILRHSGSRLLICSRRLEGIAKDVLEDFAADVTIIPLEGLSGERDAGTIDDPRGAVDPDGDAVVIYTSGTTGRPKGVRLSHRNIVSNIVSMNEAVKVRSSDIFLSVLPLNHTFECTAGLLLPLSRGASVAYSPSLRPRDLRNAIRKTRPTVMLGVPLLYEKMLNGIRRAVRRAPPVQRIAGLFLMSAGGALKKVLGPGAARVMTKRIRDKAGLDRVRLLITGAAAMPPSVFDGFETLGVPLVQGYGLTEASPVVAVNPVEKPRADSVGLPLPGIEIRIESPGQDGVGEVLVRGDNVMIGYLRDDEATSEVMSHGWLKTGDLGSIDPSGHLILAGRQKNVIVTSAGKNVYPEEVEVKLLGSRFVSEAIVVGRSPGEGRGEQPWAIVFPDRDEISAHLGIDPMELKPEQVQEVVKDEIRSLSSGLADFKRVRGFSLRDEEFPKTSTKKIKKFLFVERNQTV